MEIANKITSASVMGEDRKVPTTTEWWYRVSGTATSFRVSTEGQYGSSTVLIGIFHAVRFDSGEVFTAPECCLPCGLSDMVATTLGNAGENGKLDILFDIGARPSKREPNTKYEYVVRDPTDRELNTAAYKAMLTANLPKGVTMPEVLTMKQLPPK